MHFFSTVCIRSSAAEYDLSTIAPFCLAECRLRFMFVKRNLSSLDNNSGTPKRREKHSAKEALEKMKENTDVFLMALDKG